MESIWSILDLTEINFWHSFDTYAKVTHASITTFDFSLFDDYLINVNKQHLRQAYMQFKLTYPILIVKRVCRVEFLTR